MNIDVKVVNEDGITKVTVGDEEAIEVVAGNQLVVCAEGDGLSVTSGEVTGVPAPEEEPGGSGSETPQE